MIPLLGRDDFMRLMEEYMIASPNSEPDDDLEVWGIDPDAFWNMCYFFSRQHASDIFVHGKPVGGTLGSLFFTAFSIGYKCAAEVEIRRIANSDT